MKIIIEDCRRYLGPAKASAGFGGQILSFSLTK